MQKRSLSLSSYIITTIFLASLISIIFIILVSNKISAQTLLSTTNESYHFINKWGPSGSNYGQFSMPTGIAIDQSNNVYVVDSGNSRVQKFDSNGNFITKWGSSGSGDGQFNGPQGITVDSKDNVYVGDTKNNRIQKFDSNGNFITSWGSIGLQGIAVDKSGNVYATDGSTIHVFAPIPINNSSIIPNTNTTSTGHNQTISSNQTSTNLTNTKIPNVKNKTIQIHAGISDQF